MVIQGIMGGLQKSLIARSKGVNGSYLVIFDSVTDEPALGELKEILRKEAIPFYSELEVEVML